MTFEEHFERLDMLLRERSSEFDEMRRVLAEIRKSEEFVRLMGPAQDRLYASIASGHLKVLQHLETGDIDKAKEEAAAAVAWFHHRFEYYQPDRTGQIPQVTEVFQHISEVAKLSLKLREALQTRNISFAFSPGGKTNDNPVR